MTDDSGLHLRPRCNIAVSDGADGGEPCNESVVNPRLRVCHDHARLCARCDTQPSDPRENFCPWCQDELRAESSKPKSNDS